MAMGPGLRKASLTMHIVSSMGWMGAVGGFVALDLATVLSDEVPLLRAAYIGMNVMTTWVIVPLAIAALATGLLMGLGTKWGLFRHYWVLLSLILTLVATLVLLVQVPLIGHRAAMAADQATSDAELRSMGNMLLHSIGGTIVLLLITVLNVYKPKGLTRYGWRKQQEPVTTPVPE